MAVWEHKKIVVTGLSVLLASQFAIAIRAMTAIKGAYTGEYTGCQPTSVEAHLGAAMYTVTMFVDFVILLLTVYKTWIEYKSMYHSGIIKLIFRDGLMYFGVV